MEEGACRKTQNSEENALPPQETHPDGGWGWVVVLSAFIIQFVVIGLLNSSGVLFAALVGKFNRSKGETAWVGSLGVGVMFLCGPLTTSLCEKYSCRAVAVMGSFLCIFGLFVSSFATNLETLFVTYGLTWGLGASLCYFPTLITLMPYFNKRLAMVNGIVTSGSGFGTIAISPLAQLAVDKTGIVNCLRLLAFVHIICVPCAATFRPVKERYRLAQSPGDVLDETSPRQARHRRCSQQTRSVWKEPAFIVWVSAVALSMLGYFVPFVHIVSQASMLGISNSKASLLISYLSISSTAGKLIIGKVADLPFLNKRVIYQCSMLCMSLCMTLIPVSTTYASLVSVVVGFGFFEAAYIMLIPLVTKDIVGPRRTARALGTVFMVLSCPAMLGPPLAGWLYDASSSYETAFFVAGFVITAGVLLMFLIPLLQSSDNQAMSSKNQIQFVGSLYSLAAPASGETLGTGKGTTFYEPSTSSSSANSYRNCTLVAKNDDDSATTV